MKIGTSSEILEQLRAEESGKELYQVQNRLESAIQRVAAVLESRSRVGRITLDAGGVVIAANLEAAEIAGANQSDLIGEELALHVCEEDRPLFERNVDRTRGDASSAQSGFHPFEFEFAAAPAEKRQVRVTGMQREDDGRRPGTVTLTFVDVSESRALGAELGLIRDKIEEQVLVDRQLGRYQEKLRSMASRLSLTEERERRRIATDLHDRISQNLVFANMQLGVLANSNLDAKSASLLQSIRTTVTEAIHNTRNITSELSPPILHEQPLETALEWLAEHATRSYGLQVEFTSLTLAADRQPESSLGDDVRVVLFRGVQELLLNCHRHAQAQSAHLRLMRAADELRVEVEDDGTGFPRGGGEDRGGFGLFLLGERLKSIGGSLGIRSRPGDGTCVTMQVPTVAASGASPDASSRDRKTEKHDTGHAAQDPWRNR
ncbi:histidine kinase [Salinispira pacifica]